MSRTFTTLTTVLLFHHVLNLHLQDNTQAQIDALKQQQNQFEITFGALVNNITQIQNQLNSTTNVNDKVVILQNAIISQRQAVFGLSKILIPPFNITKNGCQQMTDQQKVNLLQQLSSARDQVYQLRNITYNLPSCPDVDAIKSDIQKQLFFLNSIQSIIYTNCSMNVILSPTIWQTNIYAPNWILGNMTIDDLIQQYYQRSIRYDNITNCPIDYPFFDGSNCIICPYQNPVFDISQKICVSCPSDSQVNDSQKKCVPSAHYTNWTNVTNYYPQNVPLPTPANGSTSCPPQAPYYNGTFCTACNLPLYFNTISFTCVSCLPGQVFNMNLLQCSQQLTNFLTKLSGTRWVTPVPNVTNVLTQRANILAINQTTGQYSECPANVPYFDGTTCISCPNQFSLQTSNCTQSPSTNLVFDPNVHTYLPMQTSQTNPNAQNLIGQLPPNNPNIPTCNVTNPYWDGVACIPCSQPFIYFDLSSLRCSVCDPQNVYNSTSRQCVPRPILYISSNQNNLLGTPAVSVQNYYNNITNTIQNNPNAILQNCPDPTQYSNYQQCFNCFTPSQYFNVQTFLCTSCSNYDPTSQTCPTQAQLYPNLTNSLWGSSNMTAVINWRNGLSSINGSQQCPASAPHYNGLSCVNCPTGQFFSYDTLQCNVCPTGQAFDVNVRTCLQVLPVGQYQTNINSTNLIYGGLSKAQWQSYYDTNRTVYPGIQDCPNQTPYYDGINCIQCPSMIPYFELEYRLCMTCPTGSTYTVSASYSGCITASNQQYPMGSDIAKMFSNIF